MQEASTYELHGKHRITAALSAEVCGLVRVWFSQINTQAQYTLFNVISKIKTRLLVCSDSNKMFLFTSVAPVCFVNVHWHQIQWWLNLSGSGLIESSTLRMIQPEEWIQSFFKWLMYHWWLYHKGHQQEQIPRMLLEAFFASDGNEQKYLMLLHCLSTVTWSHLFIHAEWRWNCAISGEITLSQLQRRKLAPSRK